MFDVTTVPDDVEETPAATARRLSDRAACVAADVAESDTLAAFELARRHRQRVRDRRQRHVDRLEASNLQSFAGGC